MGYQIQKKPLRDKLMTLLFCLGFLFGHPSFAEPDHKIKMEAPERKLTGHVIQLNPRGHITMQRFGFYKSPFSRSEPRYIGENADFCINNNHYLSKFSEKPSVTDSFISGPNAIYFREYGTLGSLYKAFLFRECVF